MKGGMSKEEVILYLLEATEENRRRCSELESSLEYIYQELKIIQSRLIYLFKYLGLEQVSKSESL